MISEKPDSDAQRHGELAEETADDSAHQQDGNEHGDQRRAHGEDGEADLARAAQGSIERLHPVFEMTADVFDDHDGIVDDEAVEMVRAMSERLSSE